MSHEWEFVILENLSGKPLQLPLRTLTFFGWATLPAGHFKLYFNGAVNGSGASCGFVVSDHRGSVLLAR